MISCALEVDAINIHDAFCTANVDSSVFLHTYISFVKTIYIFCAQLYIESPHSYARQSRGELALVCKLIGSGPTSPDTGARSKTMYILNWNDIYG